tara:strand:- start:98 stop:1195 length:1098 start_codon:yes stop_codon:yes gene_type:complete
MFGFSPFGGGPLGDTGADPSLSTTLDGVSATSAAGSFSFSTVVNLTIASATGTGAAGTLLVAQGSATALSGVSGTSAVNDVTHTLDAGPTLPSATSTSAAGTVAGINGSAVNLPAAASTGSLGTLTIASDSSVSVTGVSGTSAIGTVEGSLRTNVFIPSVSATSAINSLAISASSNITLGSIVNYLLGQPPVFTLDGDKTLVGVQGTTGVGLTPRGDANVTLATPSIFTTSIGTVSANGQARVVDLTVSAILSAGGDPSNHVGVANVTIPSATSTITASDFADLLSVNKVNLFSVLATTAVNVSATGFQFDYDAVKDNFSLERTIFIKKQESEVPPIVYILEQEPTTVFIRDDTNGLGNTVHITS